MANPTVIIVGAGPAGVRAAETLVAAGLRPIVVDEGQRWGGQIYRQQPSNFVRTAKTLYHSEAEKASRIHETFQRSLSQLDYRPESLVWALANGTAHVLTGKSTSAIPYDALLIATGATDRIFPVPGWTKPGVSTLGAAQISLKSQACAIGTQPVFFGTGPLLYLVAWQYLKAGVVPRAVLDTSNWRDNLEGVVGMLSRPHLVAHGLKYIRELKAARTQVLKGIIPIALTGNDRVDGFIFEHRGRRQAISCDAAAFGYHLRAETQLADLAKVPFSYDHSLRQYLPECTRQGRTQVRGIYLAGDGVWLAGADAAEASGRAAAFAILEDLSGAAPSPAASESMHSLQAALRFRDGVAKAFRWPGNRFAKGLPDDTVVCRCEEITAGDIRRSVTHLGSREINRTKALTRPGMGRCQGRYCGLATAEILADALALSASEVGRLRSQPPVKPLPADIEMKP